MAKFMLELPTADMKDFEKILKNTDDIFGAMTRAGAQVVRDEIAGRLPKAEMIRGLRISRTYRTPSDGGINTKVYISGYLPFKGNRKYFARRGKQGGKVYKTTEGVPLDFLANLYEYGRSDPKWQKKPFLRKAFGQKDKIEKAMLEEQKKASGGLLDG